MSASPHTVMSIIFSSMAIPCMTHPDLIARFCFTGGALTPRERLLLRCFGSQALLTGVSIGIGKWDARAYQIWSASIVPFFLFDALAYSGGFLTSLGAIGDALGNVAFIGLSFAAINKLKK
jgi:hypothetical protein